MARLVDADALVSALNNGRLKEQTGRAVPFNAGVAFALTMVEYAPTIDAVPHWIPCEERLPEEYDEYLCCDKDGEYYVYYLEDADWARGLMKNESIVAWMPLPEPYKGERKDNG